jgi:putative hydrolase of the HAD superfamily
LSNSFVGAREREQEAHRFDEVCDVIVYSHEEGFLKPDPRIYRVACNRLGVAVEAVVLLDDAQENVDGALAIGMNAILFENNRQASQTLKNCSANESPRKRDAYGAHAACLNPPIAVDA